ncbi:MAG: aryl-sulfate sulfotransferase [Pseudomonadota bacterium]
MKKTHFMAFLFTFALALPMPAVAELAPTQAMLKGKIEAQNNVDKMLLAELQSANYTLDNPFIIVDPYGESPLTAMVLFKTKEPMRISIEVLGDTKNDTIHFDFEDYEIEHSIPIYGLYPDRMNKVTLTAESKSGKKASHVMNVETSAIPERLNDVRILAKTFNPEKYASGINFVSDNVYCTAFDSAGAWRWALTSQDYKPAKSSLAYPSGKTGFFFGIMGDVKDETYVLEFNPFGKILHAYHLNYKTHHELELTEQNTLIIGAYNPKTPDIVEDYILEMDLSTGIILRDLDYKDMLDHGRHSGLVYLPHDWIHNNSLASYGKDDIVMSGNYQSLIMRHNWNKEIKWILGDPHGLLGIYDEYMLKPIGENFEYAYNHHAVDILGDLDNNPDTMDIMLFDNGMSRFALDDKVQALASDELPPYLYSRLVHYRINEKDMTVEQIWEYGKDKPELYSDWRGDADLLPNGNIIGAFDLVKELRQMGRHNPANAKYIQGRAMHDRTVNRTSTLVEVMPNKQEVWQAMIHVNSLRNMCVYRVERMDIYTENAKDLRLGEKAKILGQ